MEEWAAEAPTIRKSYPCKGARLGLDIAKSAFQVYGIDAEGKVSYPPADQAAYILLFFRRRA